MGLHSTSATAFPIVGDTILPPLAFAPQCRLSLATRSKFILTGPANDSRPRQVEPGAALSHTARDGSGGALAWQR